jgi:asparaginyl-tRNA synthetase
VLLQDNTDLIGTEVEVKGWVRTVRAQKAFTFLEVNDGSSLGGLQVILSTDSDGYSLVEDGQLTTGCSVTARGELVESPGGKQALELKATSLTLLGT